MYIIFFSLSLYIYVYIETVSIVIFTLVHIHVLAASQQRSQANRDRTKSRLHAWPRLRIAKIAHRGAIGAAREHRIDTVTKIGQNQVWTVMKND